MSQKIQVKGISDKIYFQMGSNGWQEDRLSLLEYVENNATFLNGAKIILGLRDHKLNSGELFEIKDKLSDHSVVLTDIETDDAATQESARVLGINIISSTTAPENGSKGKINQAQLNGAFIQKPIRSGQNLHFPGHVTIIGDIHPGGCVTAEGSILIWGKVKGEIHAGTSGDLNAFIIAFDLSPSRLSIAGIVLGSEKRKKDKNPEIALISGNSIKIDSWKI